jgi:hypothetical protein
LERSPALQELLDPASTVMIVGGTALEHFSEPVTELPDYHLVAEGDDDPTSTPTSIATRHNGEPDTVPDTTPD